MPLSSLPLPLAEVGENWQLIIAGGNPECFATSHPRYRTLTAWADLSCDHPCPKWNGKDQSAPKAGTSEAET